MGEVVSLDAFRLSDAGKRTRHAHRKVPSTQTHCFQCGRRLPKPAPECLVCGEKVCSGICAMKHAKDMGEA